MLAPAIEITVLVPLELESVEHDRNRSLLWFGGARVRRRRIGARVFHHERESLAVRRPGVVGDATAEPGHPLRLAARPVEQPQLTDVARVAPLGEKGEPAPVRTPLGIVLRLRRRGESDGPAAVPTGHPDVALPPVANRIHGGDGITHPATVGRDRRVAHGANAGEVVQREGPLDRRLAGAGRDRQEPEPDEGPAAHPAPHCGTARPTGWPACL